jgi:hypothetical protein
LAVLAKLGRPSSPTMKRLLVECPRKYACRGDHKPDLLQSPFSHRPGKDAEGDRLAYRS